MENNITKKNMENKIKSASISQTKSPGLKNKDFRCLILGLGESGKTLILYKMKQGEVVTTIPTIGYVVYY